MTVFSRLTLVVCLFWAATPVCSQSNLTAAQWQEDLRFLQKTVHDEYPFLFKKVNAESWDATVDSLYSAIPRIQPHEVLVGLARVVARFEYGHTVLGYWEGKVPYRQLPIVLYDFQDGIYLQGVHRDYANLAGARLTGIEGVPISQVLKMMRPVVPAENDMFVKAYGIHYLTFPEFLHAQGVIPSLKSNITLNLEQEGRVFEATIEAVPAERFPRQYGMVVPGEDWVESRDLSRTPIYLKNLERIYYYEHLPEENAVYVRHSQIIDDSTATIPQFYDEVFRFIEEHGVDKLILDVRLNGGGNNYKNKPIVTGLIRSRVNAPGKLMVIIGRRTFSACQNLVNELHNYTHAVFVGEPTGENINFYGDNRPVTLPNSGINAYLSYAWWQDKPQWENADWLAPQLAAAPTFEQYRTNQDPAVEAALAFKDSTYISDPMGHLTRLFTQGAIQKVQAEATRMIADPNYAYFDFKSEFENAASNLLNNNSIEEAYFVSSMVTGFFPEAPSAWLLHGRILKAKGEVEMARESLEKVLSLRGNKDLREQAKALLKEE